MYRLPTVSRSGLKSRASRSTSPSRSISQFAHSVRQAPIIPRYRPGGELYTVPAYLASHYNAPIDPTTVTTPVSPIITPTTVAAPISPKVKPVPVPVSPKVIPVTVPKTRTPVSPKRAPVSPKITPVPVFPKATRVPVSPKVTPIPPITTAPIIPTTGIPYVISHYTDIPVPSPITAPATVHTPYPLPHYTNVPVPSPITAPTTVHPPYPLPYYTGFPVPSPITAPIGLPRPPYPLPHYTNIPIPSPVKPSGYRIPPNPTPAPGMPWWVAAIGMGVGVGIAIVIAKERGETVVLPPMAIPSMSNSESSLLTMSTTEVGMGTESVLASLSNTVSTTIIPPMKSFLHTLFSWVGMCSTFVFFCFVAVIRAKLFAGSSSSSSTDGPMSGSLDGPTYIPPLDLATARISLDLSAKTYVEQLIAYYETLAITTDRMSLSQRKLMDDGFQTSKVHVD